MNEVIKAISERYSCRDFSPEPLSKEQLDTLAAAALAAPSAKNLQPWHIIVVTDKALLEELDSEIVDFLSKDETWIKFLQERGGRAFYNAPCIIFIASDGSEWANLDCGIVSQNIALAAHSMGLGSVICGMARIPLGGENGAEFKKRLKFPEGFVFGMSVCVGKVKNARAPHELDLSKVTYV
ncbi:MAG: nitroreductase [Defluviitaleaceae bacterium]|nr:nitroreductase [Defluviitaleaceae bacterium]